MQKVFLFFMVAQVHKVRRWEKMNFSLVLILFSAYSVIFATNLTPVFAQVPNQERFPQPIPSVEPLGEETEKPVQPVTNPENTLTPAAAMVKVEKVEVLGSTIFNPEDFSNITQKVTGRTVTLAELQNVANEITQLYLNKGYLTSRAILVDQKIVDNVVQIQVVEGGIEKIEIEGTRRLNANYVRSRVGLATGKPLSSAKLEDQLRLLRNDPLLANVEASLRPGSSLGQSVLIVRVKEADPFDAVLGIDNYSPPSVGSERLGIVANHRNLTGLGDELALSYYRTTQGGANIYDFNYRVPLNPMNGTLQLRTTINNNQVIDPQLKQFDISGESQLYEINYRQPLVRSLREEFALSLGFAVQNGQTFTFAGPTPFGFGPDAEGNSRTRVIKFGQDYVRRDVSGAWGLRSLFSFGIGIFDATVNSDPIPDGRFFSWLGQIQRVQRLSPDNLLIAQAELQLTPDSLLPSQQYVLGGGQSLRGYRQNVRAGDNGVKFSVEDRIILQKDASGSPTLQIAPFVDLGYIWNVSDNPNISQNQRFLAGVGTGLLFQPIPQLNLRLDYGIPLVNLDDRGTNAQDDGFYFSASYRF